MIGAGAGTEIKLPTGQELKERIGAALDIHFDAGALTGGDPTIVGALQHFLRDEKPKNFSPYRSAAQQIRAAMPLASSIDAFVAAHPDEKRIELCAKLAIVVTILQAESKSLLFVDPSRSTTIGFELLKGSWLNSFMQLVSEECTASDIAGRLSNIVLVIFNYDRCVEHFIYSALQTYYRLDWSTAAPLVKGMKIFHPYGTVGALEWFAADDKIQFGELPRHDTLLSLAARIRTFTEGTDADSSEIVSIRREMAMADRIVFLGFAFHKMNLDLLLPGEISQVRQDRKIVGTAHGLSQSDIEIVRADLRRRTGIGDVILEQKTCPDLFHEFRRTLSFV